MLSSWLYKIFDKFSHILICQLDVCIMSELHLEPYLKFDYVGAPCTFNFGKMAYVGNGGFSLRRVSIFIEALERGYLAVEIEWKDCTNIKSIVRFLLNKIGLHALYVSRGFINEDLIISLYLKYVMQKPSISQAAKFCQDAVIMQGITPSAYHGWEKNLTGSLKRKCLAQIKI